MIITALRFVRGEFLRWAYDGCDINEQMIFFSKVYNYKENTARVIFGPDMVSLLWKYGYTIVFSVFSVFDAIPLFRNLATFIYHAQNCSFNTSKKRVYCSLKYFSRILGYSWTTWKF